MRKKIHPWFILFFSLALFACKKVDIQFGEQFIDNGYTQVVKVDSFSVDLTSVYVDSFITSAKGTILIGAYKDPAFGQININSFLEVSPPIYTDSFATATFDSLALILRPNKSYLGDTSQPLHIDVTRLAESIVGYDDNLLNIYNTRNFAVFPTPLGSTDIVVRPNQTDTIKIRLSDALGKEFFQKLQNPNDIDLKSSNAFLQYFNGLRISSGSNNSLIIGCKDSVVMRLYYKKPGLFMRSLNWDFVLANKNHQFNNIKVDRTGTPLKDLATSKQINSKLSGNTAYTMYAAGVMTKIRFPTARDILKLPNFAKILKATLVVRPIRGTYSTFYSLPPELRLSSTTQLNMIGPDLVMLGSSGSPVAQTGNLVVDYLYGENTSYAYDVTQYLKAIVADPTINANGLLLIPPSPALETQFGRLILGNNSNNNGNTQLLIVYASVQ